MMLAESSIQTGSAETEFAVDNIIRFSYPVDGSDFTSAGQASVMLKKNLRQLGISPEIIRRTSIAMYEGEINMVIHADGGVADIEISETAITIILKDRGPGISEKVASQLFKNMITTKGSMGSGLGLFISNTVIRGKFKGSMWGENREGGGSIFGIAIPLEVVQISKNL